MKIKYSSILVMDLSSFKTQSRAAVSSGKYSSIVVCTLFCVRCRLRVRTAPGHHEEA